MNWRVKVYRKDKVIDQWLIENRTEAQAFNEAESDIRSINGDDWSLTEEKHDE